MKGYFDSIPHDKLMAFVRMRVSNRQVLKLIRMWLNVVVVEMPKKKGSKPRWDRPLQGTPQGGIISPLLANLYLHWFGLKALTLISRRPGFLQLREPLGPGTFCCLMKFLASINLD